jgi:hypothetical protein
MSKAYAVALDPGGTTGVCLVPKEERPWDLCVLELTGEHHSILFQFLLRAKPKFVICESFENRSQEAAILASRELIGIVKAYVYESDATAIWQSASTGKAFWDDAKLRKAGIYVPGLKHARDAIRHYAYWRTFKILDHSLLDFRQDVPFRRVTKLPQS